MASLCGSRSLWTFLSTVRFLVHPLSFHYFLHWLFFFQLQPAYTYPSPMVLNYYHSQEIISLLIFYSCF